MPTGDKLNLIHIIGDPIVDWRLAVSEMAYAAPVGVGPLDLQPRRYSQEKIEIVAQKGGTWLVEELLRTACLKRPNVSVAGMAEPADATSNPKCEEVSRTITIWSPRERSIYDGTPVWRMNHSLGVIGASAERLKLSLPTLEQMPTTIVICDSGYGFRMSKNVWEPYLAKLRDNNSVNIILKENSSVCVGELWEYLVEHFSDRLTVCCSVVQLRDAGLNIGSPLSWERTANEVVNAIANSQLSRAKRVVVWIGVSGAVNHELRGSSDLVYDPDNQEGDWERRHSGLTVTIGTCVAASLALESLRDASLANWANAARRGLLASRAVHQQPLIGKEGEPKRRADFAHSAAAEYLNDLSVAEQLNDAEIVPDEKWSILFPREIPSIKLLELAESIARYGPEVVSERAPLESIGDWHSVDRTEIESIRSVRSLIAEFVTRDKREQPLSLAVFGPPGAGKSFITKQLAHELAPSAFKGVEVLPFNLSQFRDADDLAFAFQDIRFMVLQQNFPIVLWDEFDSALGGSNLGWLSRFLAPMQDGVFAERGIARPFGPSIFIFAGGTSHQLSAFQSKVENAPEETKARDFLSRLRGYIDIAGPNPNKDGERQYVLRRALLLRSILLGQYPKLFFDSPEVKDGKELNIDDGVLAAFLSTSKFIHEARSLESLIKMSNLAGKTKFRRSDLPPSHQLSLHVEAAEFLRIVGEHR